MGRDHGQAERLGDDAGVADGPGGQAGQGPVATALLVDDQLCHDVAAQPRAGLLDRSQGEEHG